MADANKPCIVEGCNSFSTNRGAARGMCVKHYLRWKKYGDTSVSKIDREQTGKPCKAEGCESPSGFKGYCVNHYNRLKRHGDPLAYSQKYRVRISWIEAHVAHDGGECLIWPFGVSHHGRGQATLDGKTTSAPRIMCILAHGEPPDPAMHAAHSCGNGHIGCMHPKHLRWATVAENENDKRLHGTLRRGEAINTNKLTEDDVRAIRAAEGYRIGRKLAAQYGVTPSCISTIRTRQSWKWLE